MSLDWKKIVGTVAPVLGTALGGPFGGMAGKFLSERLGVEEKDLEETILAASPETMVKIKELEYDFKLQMKEIGLKQEQLVFQDRADARSMARQKGIWPQAVLTAIFLAGYFSLIYLFFRNGDVIGNLDDFSKGQLGILIGVLTAAVPQILNFWFGSSSGSKSKTELINNSNKG